MQESVIINDIEVPIILEGDKKWYPISYLFQKVMNINTSASVLHNKSGLKNLVKIFVIDYGYDSGGVQNVYCIKEEGIKIYLTKYLKVGRYNIEQRKSINGVLKYLGVQLLSEERQFLSKYNYKGKYSTFIEDCVDEVLKESPNIKWQKCSKCNNYYPYHENFFRVNLRSPNGLNVQCKYCQKPDKNTGINYKIKQNNKFLNDLYNKFGEDIYLCYKNKDIIKIYSYYKDGITSYPEILNNRENTFKVIKWLYDKGDLNRQNLLESIIKETFKINISRLDISMDEVYNHLFDNHWREYPWEYPNVKLKNLTYEEGKVIFNNYISTHNILIDDVFNFDYSGIMKKAKLTCYLDNCMEFIIRLYEYKYPAYKFKRSGVNFYKDKENRIRDLKYFIEEDVKIELDKIPLYLTKMKLQRNARTLYMLLYRGNYYKNLFEWVNECYPNRFVEADFVINPYRDEFDSQEEVDIDNILRSYFKDRVLYNQRDSERTIKINGMLPDWIIFNDKGCLLVEYFGLWVGRENVPKRNLEYMEKAIKKIGKYKTMNRYYFMDIYPNDLNNNFEVLKNKILNFLESK